MHNSKYFFNVMKSSLDLCPRDLHIVFGKNRAWQWQCLWPESALLCVPLSPKVIFVILYLHKLPRECASHAQSWFSALFLTKRAGVAQTASLFYMPFQGEFTSKAFAALIARIRSTSTFFWFTRCFWFLLYFFWFWTSFLVPIWLDSAKEQQIFGIHLPD